MVYPLLIILILLLFAIALLLKIQLLRSAMREIVEAFQDRLAADTNALIDVSSRDSYVLKLASNINQQLRLLRTQRHRFQQGDRELKEAVTNLSHDLRTPLTAINGYLDLLDREDKSETVQRYLSHIRNRTEALKELTEELFRYSVVTSEQALKREPVNLVRALEEKLVSFYGAMKEKNIEPEIRLPDEPIWRELDSDAVSRIFSNIIGNAMKYSDGDFFVSIDENGVITFANAASNLNAITVGRLFDRFYTVEDARNSTGLGLSIAKGLTNRMGGSIDAQFQDNRLIIRLVLTGTPLS